MAPHFDAADFAALAQQLTAQPTLEPTLQAVVDIAVQTIDGCDYAGVSLVHGRKSVETPAATDQLVFKLDQAQYDHEQGPCLDALFVEVLTAHVYARHASAILALTGQIDSLNTALQTRHQIGLAQGLLMQRYGLSEEQAFQFLTRVSDDSNTKLGDVAQLDVRVLGDAREEPERLVFAEPVTLHEQTWASPI
jgi:ANTAR domain-containing protein